MTRQVAKHRCCYQISGVEEAVDLLYDIIWPSRKISEEEINDRLREVKAKQEFCNKLATIQRSDDGRWFCRKHWIKQESNNEIRSDSAPGLKRLRK
jgi:hypothetical protein